MLQSHGHGHGVPMQFADTRPTSIYELQTNLKDPKTLPQLTTAGALAAAAAHCFSSPGSFIAGVVHGALMLPA
jgi:hypothetical protein